MLLVLCDETHKYYLFSLWVLLMVLSGMQMVCVCVGAGV